MKPIIIEMKDLSESTEIYEKKPNPAIVGFIYILLGIIVISVLWMTFSEVDIVTESFGVIGYTDDVTEVNCDREAKIVACNVADGQYVTEGTVLFELKAMEDDKDAVEDKDSKNEDLVDGHPVIRAKENGYFYATSDAEVGAIVASETRVGLIFPKPQQTFQAVIVVGAENYGKVREGQQVRIEVDALPASEYGTITGTVRKIADEAQWDQQSGSSYFLAWVEFDTTKLAGKNNAEVDLVSGLPCNAKIVTERKKVIAYVWESIR